MLGIASLVHGKRFGKWNPNRITYHTVLGIVRVNKVVDGDKSIAVEIICVSRGGMVRNDITIVMVGRPERMVERAIARENGTAEVDRVVVD